MKIFLIGSCRVWRPLRPLHTAGMIELTNRSDPQWFTHTSRAAVQFIESALGRRQIPAHLHNLIVETKPSDRQVNFDGRKAIADADAILIEISSLKSFDVDGYEMNQHRLRRSDLKPPVRTLSSADVLGHLASIEAMTGKPLILIDHIPFGPDGQVIPAREVITNILRDSGRAFVSKRDFMRPEWLADTNHHKFEHEAEIGRHILDGLAAAKSAASIEGLPICSGLTRRDT